MWVATRAGLPVLQGLAASVGCVRRGFLRRNAPLLEFIITFLLVFFGKMGGKMVRYAVANAPYALRSLERSIVL